MKKWARISLALLLIATLSLGSVLPASASQFQDVTRSGVGEEIFDAINYVSDNGLLVGTTTTTFGPNTTLTRAMIVAILYRWSGDGGSYSNPFTDVYPSDYYYNAVGWAKQNGIVYGTTETQFSPTKTVTTEQFFAFLYRYALKYHSDKTDYTEASITSHPDYNRVTEYAKPSLRWAKQHHILQLTNSDYLWPQSGMARKNVALYITRYSLQVKGFDEKDRFSFVNSCNSSKYANAGFSSKYVLNDTFYQKLKSDVYSTAGNDAAKAIDRIEGMRNQPFGGSCYGMSLVQYFDKIGKIDFNKNTTGAKNMRSVPYPRNNSTVESVINYYHFTQFIANKREVEFSIEANNIEKGPSALHNAVQQYGPLVCGYWSDLGAHCVIVLDSHLEATSPMGADYTFEVMDPNEPTITEQTVGYNSSYTVGSDDSGVYWKTDNEEYSLRELFYIPLKNMSLWYSCDFDGIYNTRSYARSAALTPEITTEGLPKDTVTLFLSDTPFCIQNAEGKRLVYDGSNLSGDLEILDRQCSYTGGEINYFDLTVPYSDTFIYESLGNQAYFGVSTSTYFGCISGDGITKITLDDTHSVQVEGNCQNVYINGRLAQSSLEYLAVSGALSGTATVQYTETGADISGLQGEGNLSATHINPVVHTVETSYTFDSDAISIDTTNAERMSIRPNEESSR